MKKLIATGLLTLMVLATFATAVLAADLGGFPGNTASVTDSLSTVDAYVVVGSAGSTSAGIANDIAGAVDVAFALATQSYQTQTVSGTTSGVTGTERKVAIPTTASGDVVAGSTSNLLPSTLRNYHFSGLQQGQYAYKSTNHNFHEEVRLPTTGSALLLTHKLSDPVNGTIKMKIDSQSVEYRYVFEDTVSASDFNATTTADYDNPLEVVIAGKAISITRIPSQTSFVALSGNVGWVVSGATTGVTTGSLTALVDNVYSGTQASVRIIDSAGNLVQNLGVVGQTAKTFTYSGKTYSVKIISTATSTKEAVADSAKLVFSEGDAEKTFDASDTATVTEFGADWKIGCSFATQGRVATSDYIYVKYLPSALEEKNKYYVTGSVFKGPNDYFELSYAGLYPGKFAKITISPVTGKTVYNSTVSTGYATVSGLNGLEISSDVAGSVVYGGTGYDKVYVLFNATPTSTNFDNTGLWLGYWDKTTSRIVQFTGTVAAAGADADATDPLFLFTLSYGGPGSTVTYSLNGTYSSSTLIGNMVVNSSTTVTQIDMNYLNRSAATAGSAAELILGAEVAKVNSNDVVAKIEQSTNASADISSQLGDVISDGGVYVYSVKSNVESDKVVLGIPPETVYALAQFGKVGAATSGSTYNAIIGVTSAVAKLDSEMTDAMKASKNLVLVGGPCVNTVAQELVTNGKLDATYTCAGGVVGSAWAANTGYIVLVEDAFATGKIAILAAGTKSEQTRMATSVLQSYQAYSAQLASKTTVTFTGTAVANIVFA
jgi:hypothetical protein